METNKDFIKALKHYAKDKKSYLIAIKNNDTSDTYMLKGEYKLDYFKDSIYESILDDQKRNKKISLHLDLNLLSKDMLIGSLIKYIK